MLIGLGIILLIILFRKMNLRNVVKNFRIRKTDKFGSGQFGSKRTNHIHQGIDIVVSEGEKIYAPTDLTLVRKTYPYRDDMNYVGGVYKTPNNGELKFFYMNPDQSKREFKQGEVIGIAQDISKKYGSSMTPHVHIEYRENGILKDPNNYV